MNTKNIVIALVASIVGLGSGYALGGSYQAPRGGHMMPDGSMMGQSVDQHFIVQMIPHHDGAIAMAKLALERSKRPEMLKLASDIIAAQQREIDDMRSWYRSWYGSSVPAGGMGMMAHMGSMAGDMSALESASASDFDREFIVQMIPHHEMAVMMAQMLAASTDRPEMKQLAQNITTSQSSEIELMRGWLVSWTNK